MCERKIASVFDISNIRSLCTTKIFAIWTNIQWNIARNVNQVLKKINHMQFQITHSSFSCQNQCQKIVIFTEILDTAHVCILYYYLRRDFLTNNLNLSYTIYIYPFIHVKKNIMFHCLAKIHNFYKIVTYCIIFYTSHWDC